MAKKDEYSFLAIKVSNYKASVDASINYEVRHKRHYSSDAKVYKFSSHIESEDLRIWHEDSVFLRSLEIGEAHDCCGMKFENIFRSTGKGVQLWGYFPRARRNELKNPQGDFEYHFLTDATGRYTEHIVEPGDILILASSVNHST